MPLSRQRDYLSIGEVLESLRADFPDVSISKIRFLEAAGLISPERTPSGYRKFYEPDVARLRHILSLQRDQFLPLKVIRERLFQVDSNGGSLVVPGTPAEPPSAPPAPAVAPSEEDDVTGVQLTRAELRSASGLDEGQLGGLEEFGILHGNDDGTYDEHALLIAGAAAKLFEYGLEPRHLRMYRQFADREASLFEQVVSPVARKRNPEGGREAARSMRALLGASRQLREGVLRAGLRDLLDRV